MLSYGQPDLLELSRPLRVAREGDEKQGEHGRHEDILDEMLAEGKGMSRSESRRGEASGALEAGRRRRRP